MSDSIKIIIRAGTDSDHAFVGSTWAKGIYFGSDHLRNLPEEVYYRWFPGIIAALLRRPDTQVNIACDAENPRWIAGCAAFDEDSLYWVYVKEGFRNQGLASLLIEKAPISGVKALTAVTKAGFAFMEKKGFSLKPL